MLNKGREGGSDDERSSNGSEGSTGDGQ